MTSVAVLGGGIGGLSAAHELAERDVSVTVYEAHDRFGGKARSFPGPALPDGTHLPSEHGFRFFPGFYRHVTDTMERIPDDGGSVKDNLIETTEFLQVADEQQWTMPTGSPETLREFRTHLGSLFGGPIVSTWEKAYYVARLVQLLTSCDERWDEQYETTSWWRFIDAEQMSPAYRRILGRGISQLFVAADPEVASTRTIGRIHLQMLQDHFDETLEVDYVLDGPTSDAWIDPWVAYLEELDVDLRSSASVEAIRSDGDRVTGVSVEVGGEVREIEADYYVAALPVEAMRDLLDTNLERTAPSLRGVRELDMAFMNGIQFYLKCDVPMVAGHGIYYDSPWALTTVSQRQFWPNYEATYFGGDEVGGVLSVIISDWTTPGVVHDKPVSECTPEEIKEEVWAQLKRHLNTPEGVVLNDDDIYDWYLDPAIEYDDAGKARSSEPLLINTAGSLRHRPDATTEAENLLLAADYVRTYTDLATMEAANEAARRAVNAILERSGIDAAPCAVHDLSFPPMFDALRRVDTLLYRRDLPHPGEAISRLGRAVGSIRRS